MNAGGGGLRWDRWMLLACSALAAGLLLATPQLIQPYPAQVAWYESPALFPRLALCLVLVGGLVECLLRRGASAEGASDELDSRAASMPRALAMAALFAVYLFAVPWMGYWSSTLLFLLAGGSVAGLGQRATWALALGMSTVMWGVFVHLLKVSFGHGLLV